MMQSLHASRMCLVVVFALILTSSASVNAAATKQAAAAPGDSSPPDPRKPCLVDPVSQPSLMYLTATNKCPRDTFSIAIVSMPGDAIYATGPADVSPGVKHQWFGPYITLSGPSKDPKRHLAIIRSADGKVVVPKGINPDGAIADVSATKKRVCLIFEEASKPQQLAIFRAKMTADGLRVVGDDFAGPIHPRNQSVPCEQYSSGPGPNGEKRLQTKAVGRMVDVYAPGSCNFIIDDCSS